MSNQSYRDHFSDLQRERRLLSLPKACEPRLVSSQTQLHQERWVRMWALPPSTTADEVRHYLSRKSALNVGGPNPVLAGGVNAGRARQLSLRIKGAVSYLELSENADELIQPILLYYAFSNLSGVVSSAFFNWPNQTSGHGLKVQHANDIESSTITILLDGSFPRLVASLFLLRGKATPFDRLITYSKSLTHHTGVGELLERFVSKEEGSPRLCMSFDAIRNFDHVEEDEVVKRTHGMHKGTAISETALLLDGLTIYLASSYARYRPVAWRDILDGAATDARMAFDDAFERFKKFGFDRLLATLKHPSDATSAIGWESHYYDNPYSQSRLVPINRTI